MRRKLARRWRIGWALDTLEHERLTVFVDERPERRRPDRLDEAALTVPIQRQTGDAVLVESPLPGHVALADRHVLSPDLGRVELETVVDEDARIGRQAPGEVRAPVGLVEEAALDRV